MFSRRLVALALAVLVSAANVAVCAGWAPTPEARMACCTESGACPMHKSASNADDMRVVSQADADRCCALSERDDSAPSSGAYVFTVALAIVTSPVPCVASELNSHQAGWHSPVPNPANNIPKHLLLSVFLV